MEHFFGLFFRSIFVDNMIFAFFLGMCVEECEDVIRIGYGRNLCVVGHRAR